MIEQELIRIWQSSPQQEQVKFDKSRLMIDLQSNLDRFHNAMKWLYLRESLGAIIAIPAFGYFAFQAPNLLSQIGAGLIALWAAYILLVVRKTKKRSPEGATSNYMDFLKETQQYLELQMKLRLAIFWWYVLPFMTFCYLFILGIILEKSGSITHILGGGVYCLVIGITIFYLNKRSATKVVAPKLEKVSALIKAMES